jgi:ubiquinone/menaquinone biosynthesis C-methylase UbiE
MSDDRHRFDPQRKQRLLDPERQAHWDPPAFLSRLGIAPGQTVVDAGCGPGFWTLALAGLAGEQGTVWALDVSQELLDDLAARNPPPQVRLLRADLSRTGLPAGTADLAWLAFVFHEVMPPEGLATELRRIVMPGGRVAVLDWRPDAAGDAGAPRSDRLWPAQVIELLQAAGFARARQTWEDPDSYLVEAG